MQLPDVPESSDLVDTALSGHAVRLEGRAGAARRQSAKERRLNPLVRGNVDPAYAKRRWHRAPDLPDESSDFGKSKNCNADRALATVHGVVFDFLLSGYVSLSSKASDRTYLTLPCQLGIPLSYPPSARR